MKISAANRRPKSPWIEFRSGNSSSELRLFCFHGAGGAAHAFRSWADRLPKWIEICPIQLPGRLTRIAEPLHRRFAPLLDALVIALEVELDRPTAFFGHSLGALLAFEVARALRNRRLPMPQVILAAARMAPNTPVSPLDVQRLNDRELLALVQMRYGSIPEEITREPELQSLVLKPLRADLELHDAYVYRPEPPLCCSLVALGGASDPLVTRAGLEAWREHTTAHFKVHMFPGSHFFHQEQEGSVLRIVAEELEARRKHTA